jgi:hypothetical protein
MAELSDQQRRTTQRNDLGGDPLALGAGACVRVSGTVAGMGVTVTAAAGAKVRKGGPQAKLTSVTAAGTQLDARGCINGGSNTNVRFGGVPSVVTLAA